MLDRRSWPGGARFLSWRMFKGPNYLSASWGLFLLLGGVTKDQLLVRKSLRMMRQGAVEKKIVPADSVGEVWPW